MYPGRDFHSLAARPLTIALLTIIMCALPVMAQSPAEGTDPFALMRTTQGTGDAVQVQLEASLKENGEAMQDGLIWRVFSTAPDPSGHFELIATSEGGAVTLNLPPGEYYINCAFGRASSTRRVNIAPSDDDQKFDFVLNAGGLALNATIGDSGRADPEKLRFAIYEDNERQRDLVIDDVRPDTIVRLRQGTYEIVSTYGDLNAEAHARLRVKAGEITEATLKQRAALVTLKLVATDGGEAIADTAWTVLGASGDVLTESTSVYPTMILAEGTYTVIARNKEDLFEKSFTVIPGQALHVELNLTDDRAKMTDESVD